GMVHLQRSGIYYVDSLDKKLTLYTESGTGFLNTTATNGRQIDDAMQGEIADDQPEVVVRPYPFQMLNLSDPGTVQNTFGAVDPTATPDEMYKKLPQGWACANEEPNTVGEPPAVWQPTSVDQRNVLQMVRPPKDTANQTLGHAETGCEFWFPKNPDGLDISQ